MITLYFRTPTLFVVHFLEQLRILLRMRIHTVIMKKHLYYLYIIYVWRSSVTWFPPWKNGLLLLLLMLVDTNIGH